MGFQQKKKPEAEQKVRVLGKGDIPPLNYIEVSIEVKGSINYQSVGGHIGFQTSDPRLLPVEANREAIVAKIKEHVETISIGVEPLCDKIMEGLDWLSQQAKKHETRR